MEGNILDDFYFDDEEIKNNADIKKRLIRGGIRRTYELKNGAVLAKESEAIQVSIRIVDGNIIVKPKFPKIGNTVQILASLVLLIFFFSFRFPFPFIPAILGGQFFSYFWNQSKIRKLQIKVENLL